MYQHDKYNRILFSFINRLQETEEQAFQNEKLSRDITYTEVHVVYELGKYNAPQAMNVIAQDLGITQSSLTSLVDKIEKKRKKIDLYKMFFKSENMKKEEKTMKIRQLMMSVWVALALMLIFSSVAAFLPCDIETHSNASAKILKLLAIFGRKINEVPRRRETAVSGK